MNYGQRFLRENGIERPRKETFLITQKIMKKSYLDLLIDPNLIIPFEKKKEILKRMYKRANGKPISKIFGVKEFYSNEFFINSKALDPRPETEFLVDVSKKILEDKVDSRIDILELGVGSGCLIISILLELSNLKTFGLGVDISNDTIRLAKKNIRKFNLERFLKVKKSNWFSNISGKFDLIISNPPYLKTKEICMLRKEVKSYDPFISLDGGFDGLSCYREIAKNAKHFLKENGAICLELGFNQLERVNNIFNRFGYKKVLKEKDLQEIDRVVVYKRK